MNKESKAKSLTVRQFCDLTGYKPAAVVACLSSSGVPDGAERWLLTPHLKNKFKNPGFTPSAQDIKAVTYEVAHGNNNMVLISSSSLRDLCGGLFTTEGIYWTMGRGGFVKRIFNNVAYWEVRATPETLLSLGAWLRWCASNTRISTRRFTLSSEVKASLSQKLALNIAHAIQGTFADVEGASDELRFCGRNMQDKLSRMSYVKCPDKGEEVLGALDHIRKNRLAKEKQLELDLPEPEAPPAPKERRVLTVSEGDDKKDKIELSLKVSGDSIEEVLARFHEFIQHFGNVD